MRVLGITGGIASGKSFVADFFRSRGIPVIDADAVARELSRPGRPLLAEIVAAFGEGFTTSEGELDRPKLGQLIFADPDARLRLNALAHPPILAAIDARLRALRDGPNLPPLVAVVVPLLFEAGARDAVDRTLLLVAEEEERVRRLQARDGLTPEAARRRIAAQMPRAQQEPLADWVLDTTPGKAATLLALESLWPQFAA